MSEQAHILEIKVYPENKYIPNSKVPCNSADIIPLLEAKYNKYKWAWILHDKDLLSDGSGELCKPHVQFAICATNTTLSLDKIRREYSISYSNVYAKDDWNETVKYLVHRSKKSVSDPNKYKYSLCDLHANFDYSIIFGQGMKDVLDESDLLVHLVKTYFEKNLSLLDLGKYAGSIGQFGWYRKNFSLINAIINDERKRYTKTRNYTNGNFPY